MSIPSILLEFGCQPGPLFDRSGIDLAQFEEPDNEVPFVAASKLLAACVEATGCQHFGLLIGERASPSSLGIPGFMLQSAPDVGTALQTLMHYLDLHDQGGIGTLSVQGENCLFGYAICQSGVAAADQVYDLSITVICNILRNLCGKTWKPAEVLLSRRPPPDFSPYERILQAPILFNAEQSAVVFKARWLVHRLASADPLLYRHLEKEAAKLHVQQAVTVTDRLRNLLRKSMANGKSTNTDCAKQLCMHERTLHRRLEDEGTSFRQVLEDMRYDMARQLLADTAMRLSDISRAVGYSDTSSFVRSFKRWSATTPMQWRSDNVHRENRSEP